MTMNTKRPKRSNYELLPPAVLHCIIRQFDECQFWWAKQGVKVAFVCKQWAYTFRHYSPQRLRLQGSLKDVTTLQQLLKTGRQNCLRCVDFGLGDHESITVQFEEVAALLGMFPQLTEVHLRPPLTHDIFKFLPSLKKIVLDWGDKEQPLPDFSFCTGLQEICLPSDHGPWDQELPESVQTLDIDHVDNLKLPKSLQELSVWEIELPQLRDVLAMPCIDTVCIRGNITTADDDRDDIVLPIMKLFTVEHYSNGQIDGNNGVSFNVKNVTSYDLRGCAGVFCN